MISWPAVIRVNARSSVPVYVPDFLPTFLDVIGAAHPHPGFASDGASLLPLLRGDAWTRPRGFLAWRLGSQVALLDAAGRYKYVRNPDAGQCSKDASTYPYNDGKPLVFDLSADPTESTPIADPAKIAELHALATAWESSIATSQLNESRCLPPTPTPSQLQRGAGGCLAAVAPLVEHAALSVNSACAPAALNTWLVSGTTGAVTMAAAGGATWCFHNDNRAAQPCAVGTTVWMGSVCTASSTMTFDAVRTRAEERAERVKTVDRRHHPPLAHLSPPRSPLLLRSCRSWAR